MFIINSNYSQIAAANTLKEAKSIAQTESYKYDDVVIIEKDGRALYMLQYGAIYRLTRTK